MNETEDRWAWLVRIEGDLLQLTTEAGVEDKMAQAILDDPEGWGFDDIPEEDRASSYLMADMVMACVYGDLMHLAEQHEYPWARKTLEQAAGDWLDTRTAKLSELRKKDQR
ncbi:hypothetical protein LCGC14_0273770 [marine sediment metagenome]|uniref:Uncharacterized protein n=2 Tax=root TaxID=1 RepID=A0A9C9TJ74_9HYPH|nr:hypothetical protein [Aurantimonas coralicida]